MARYSIDFTTNASYILQEIEKINKAIAKTARTGKSVQINIDTANLSREIDNTFRKLDRQISAMQTKLSNLKIGSRKFQEKATGIGVAEGLRERGTMQAQSIRLGAQAEAFDIGSATRLQKQLQAARIEASQIAPNTEEWLNLQKQIGLLKSDLLAADRLAENIQMQQNLGAFAPGSLNALESKLIVLRNRAREISPDTDEWKKLNSEIVKTEQSIEKQNRKPLTKGQRFGAAGGAFLYGGGLGGGVGSAVGGIAGGLLGGVPGAFTGAAVGQLADNLGNALAGMTSQASAVQQMQRGLAMASVDAKDFAEAQSTVAAMSQKLLMPLEQTTRLFTQLRVNTKQYNLSVQDTARIMEGTALAIAATGGNSEDLEGAMRAVVQIFSKGGVQAEELRGQLGERFPGAVVKFAQANKLSFEELQKGLEEGKIGIKEFVAFAEKNYTDYSEFSKQLATAPEYAGKRLQIAFEGLSRELGGLFAPLGAGIQDALTEGIKGITNFVAENRVFIKQFISDWGSIIGPIVKIIGQLMGVLAKFSIEVGKIFQGLFSAIRQSVGLANIGEAKARFDKAKAAVKGKTRPTQNVRGGGAFVEYDQAKAAFEALGGEAAYKKASQPLTPSNLTYGGPGAGMSLERAGKGEGADGRGKKLQDYTSEQINLLQRNIALNNELIDSNVELTARERELAKAEFAYLTGLKIVDAQHALKIKDLDKLTVNTRALAKSEADAMKETEKNILKQQYNKAVLGDLYGITDDYSKIIQDKELNIVGLSSATGELTEREKLETIILNRLSSVKKEDLHLFTKRIELARNMADQIDVLTQAEKDLAQAAQLRQNVTAKQKEISAMGAGLGAGFYGSAAQAYETALLQPGATPEYAKQMADLETQSMKLQAVFGSIQNAIGGVGDAFGTMMTQGITQLIQGTASAQEVFSSFLKSVGDALLQAASQMISTYVAIGIARIFAGLGGGGEQPDKVTNFNAAVAAYGLAEGGYLPGGFKAFADGGMVTGPTLGLIGEGGEPEYVIPQSKMRGAMERYAAGTRGASVIPASPGGAMGGDTLSAMMAPIELKYQVERINSVDYVTNEQFQMGMRRAATQGAVQGEQRTLKRLQMSSSTRKRVGL